MQSLCASLEAGYVAKLVSLLSLHKQIFLRLSRTGFFEAWASQHLQELESEKEATIEFCRLFIGGLSCLRVFTSLAGTSFPWTLVGSEKKTHKEKTCKQNFHGIIPGFWGEFCLCVLFSPIGMTRKKHINNFLAPTQSRDNPANLFMFMCFFP